MKYLNGLMKLNITVLKINLVITHKKSCAIQMFEEVRINKLRLYNFKY